jgi:hypothetical protein
MTTRLSALREAFIAFHENPKAYLDFDNLSHYDNNADGSISYLVRGKSLEQVTGLKALGSGCYATAYAVDDKRVLKVLNSTDAGYDRFVRRVVKVLGRKNPFVPKIYYRGTWGSKNVYLLERLEETNRCYSSLPGYPKNDYDAARRWKRENRELIEAFEKENRERSRLNSAFREAIDCGMAGGRAANAFMRLDPKLQALCDLLKETRSTGDMHAGNVMFRGNTPVLTDPVAGGDETEESLAIVPNESEEEQHDATWGW